MLQSNLENVKCLDYKNYYEYNYTKNNPCISVKYKN